MQQELVTWQLAILVTPVVVLLLFCRQEVATLEEAVSLLNALVKYVHENNVADWQEQADMAKELGSLLKEKLDLVHRFSEL